MRKIAAVSTLATMLVLTLAALTTRSLAQTSPTIVATVKLTGQTAAVPKTTLFTPTADGMFRITAYMVTTVPTTNGSKADWLLRVGYTDDAGSWILGTVANVPAYQRSNSNVFGNTDNWPLTFWATSGTPITYAVPPINGDPTGSTYEVFITLEQLM